MTIFHVLRPTEVDLDELYAKRCKTVSDLARVIFRGHPDVIMTDRRYNYAVVLPDGSQVPLKPETEASAEAEITLGDDVVEIRATFREEYLIRIHFDGMPLNVGAFDLTVGRKQELLAMKSQICDVTGLLPEWQRICYFNEAEHQMVRNPRFTMFQLQVYLDPAFLLRVRATVKIKYRDEVRTMADIRFEEPLKRLLFRASLMWKVNLASLRFLLAKVSGIRSPLAEGWLPDCHEIFGESAAQGTIIENGLRPDDCVHVFLLHHTTPNDPVDAGNQSKSSK